MAAGTSIQCFLGGSVGSPGSTVEIKSSEMRHKRADNITVDLVTPVPIPTGAGSVNYSWRKHTKMFWTSAPAEEIRNLRWYTVTQAALTLWTGVTLYVGLTPDASYTPGSAADESAKIPNSADAQGYLTGSPLTVNSGKLCDKDDSFPCESGSAETQDHVVQQIGVNSTASSGVTAARTCYYRYDEI